VNASPPRLERLLLRAALRLFPISFRDQYGEEIYDTYVARRARHARERLAFLFTISTVANLVREAGVEHARAWLLTLDARRQDLRDALRSFARRPLFSCMAVATLGVGIAGNVAIFTLADALLFAPLPFPSSNQLVIVDETRADGPPGFVSVRSYLAWQAEVHSGDFAAANPWTEFNLELPDRPERVMGSAVTAEYFDVMGLPPVVGRGFTPEDLGHGAAPAVVLGERIWRERFAADRAVVGTPVMLHGERRTIVGVMPRAWGDGKASGWADVWIPLRLDTPALLESTSRWLRVVARVREPGGTAALQADLARVQARLAAEHPRTHAGRNMVVRTLREALAGDSSQRLAVIWTAGALLLLIASVNVAALLVTRSVERSRELAVRLALGAGRRRIGYALLAEGVVLGVAGGAAGLALAAAVLPAIVALVLPSLPLGLEVQLGASTVLFTSAVSVAVGGGLSVLPVFWTGGAADPAALRDRSQSHGIGTTARRGLVAGQVALALVLLCTAGLVAESVRGLMRVDAGFDTERLLIVSFTLPQQRYADSAARRRFYQQLVQRVGTIGTVESAGASDYLPLEGGWQKPVIPVGEPPPPPGSESYAYSKPVTTGFFATMGIPLLAGREFTEADVLGGRPVVAIDAAAAARFFPGVDPLERELRHAADGPALRIVAVVGSAAHRSLADGPLPAVYHPDQGRADLQLVVRTTGPPSAAVPDVRRVLGELDPSVPIGRIRTADDLLDRTLGPWRVDLTLLGLFAAVSLLLALVGVYAVTSAVVGERTREIGILIALGATPALVRRSILRDVLVTAAAGCAAGVPMAAAIGRFAEFRRFAVSSFEPSSAAGAATVLILAVMLAAYLPARRASVVDPNRTLRGE